MPSSRLRRIKRASLGVVGVVVLLVLLVKDIEYFPPSAGGPGIVVSFRLRSKFDVRWDPDQGAFIASLRHLSDGGCPVALVKAGIGKTMFLELGSSPTDR